MNMVAILNITAPQLLRPTTLIRKVHPVEEEDVLRLDAH